jgi:capsular exopolysaccharide synthesis family protein
VSGTTARFLRVHLWWTLLCAAVVAAVAWQLADHSTPMYASTASVVVEARIVPNTTPVAPDVTTEKEVVSSGVVVEKAAAGLGVSMDEIDKNLKVTVPADTKILSITYYSPNPKVAQHRAQAVANAYLAFRNAGDGGSKSTKNDAKDSDSASVSARLLTPAGLPTKPEGRSPAVTAALGGFVGLLLGLGTALARDALNDRLRSREDFEQRARALVIAEIPRLRRGQRRSPLVGIDRTDRDSAVAEAFRYLRVRLAGLGADRKGGTVVLVTSSGAEEGRTTVAAHLAASMALSGDSVIAVDADLRHPALHRSFGTDRTVGLSSVLAGECAPFQALRPSRIEGLQVMSAGWPDRHAGDLLAPEPLRDTFDVLLEQADYVIVDCPPVLAASDAVALAMVSDVVVLVADEATTRRAVTEAHEQLAATDSGLVVGVINHRPRHWPRLFRRRTTVPALAPPPSFVRPTAAPLSSAPDPVRPTVPPLSSAPSYVEPKPQPRPQPKPQARAVQVTPMEIVKISRENGADSAKISREHGADSA